jgi:hypothetical protein
LQSFVDGFRSRHHLLIRRARDRSKFLTPSISDRSNGRFLMPEHNEEFRHKARSSFASSQRSMRCCENFPVAGIGTRIRLAVLSGNQRSFSSCASSITCSVFSLSRPVVDCGFLSDPSIGEKFSSAGLLPAGADRAGPIG